MGDMDIDTLRELFPVALAIALVILTCCCVCRRTRRVKKSKLDVNEKWRRDAHRSQNIKTGKVFSNDDFHTENSICETKHIITETITNASYAGETDLYAEWRITSSHDRAEYLETAELVDVEEHVKVYCNQNGTQEKNEHENIMVENSLHDANYESSGTEKKDFEITSSFVGDGIYQVQDSQEHQFSSSDGGAVEPIVHNQEGIGAVNDDLATDVPASGTRIWNKNLEQESRVEHVVLDSLEGDFNRISEEHSESLGVSMKGESYSKSSVLERNYNTSASEEYSTSEQEVQTKFVITGVIDTRTGQEVSLTDAIASGIINQDTGIYVDRATGRSMPIAAAMADGRIKVEVATSSTSEEQRKDIGLLTVYTHQESRPFTVTGVLDAMTDERHTVEEAVAMGILELDEDIYFNRRDNIDMSLQDAYHSGLLEVDFDENSDSALEVTMNTFAIHAVVDQRRKTKLPFKEAINSGLLDVHEGRYYHNVLEEYMDIGHAVSKGFIKATIVKDPKTLDIDPSNIKVVAKVLDLHKKLVVPLNVISAMRKAAEEQ